MGLMLYWHTAGVVCAALLSLQLFALRFIQHRTFTKWCAVAIQATWRGWRARRLYLDGNAIKIQRRWKYAAARTRVARLRKQRADWEQHRFVQSHLMALLLTQSADSNVAFSSTHLTYS